MIVFVAGVYKSGTSYVTSLLEEMDMPICLEDWRRGISVSGTSRDYNILESYEVNMINNDILKFFNQNEIECDIDKLGELPHYLKYRILNIYGRYDSHCVIKDPRFIFTLQYWLDLIPEGQEHRIIWVYRSNVNDIINSFQKDVWFNDKIHHNRSYRYVVDDLQSAYFKQIEKISEGIEVYYDILKKYETQVYMSLYDYLKNDDQSYDNGVKGIWTIYFTEYYNTPENVKNILSRQCPNNIPTWENVIAVDNQDDADFIIVQDKTATNIIDKDKVIFFGREPKHVPGAYRNWNDICAKKYHHADDDMWMPQTWWVDIDYEDLQEINPEKIGQPRLSVIDSGKTITNMHQKRVEIINALVGKYPKDIDVYGKITNENELPYRDKKAGLLPYRYNLAIENGSVDNYFSEKFCDPLLCYSMPIYWGCKNIQKYFPDGSYYWIDINKPMNYLIDEIIDASKSNLCIENMSSIMEARELIMTKYNIWPTIKKTIDEIHLS